MKKTFIAILSAAVLLLSACTPSVADTTAAQTDANETDTPATEKVYEDIGSGKFSVAEDTLYLTVGDSLKITPEFDFEAGNVEYSYTFDGKYISSENGVLKAIAAGDSTVIVKDEKYGQTAEVKVVAVSNLRDNIIISVPIWRVKWANDEQFGYMDAAQVDVAVAVSGIETKDYKTSEKMLGVAEATWGGGTGVRVLVHSTELLDSPGFKDAKIKKLCDTYSQYRAFAGFHVIDEPFDANPFGAVEKRFSEALPGYIYDTNFLPGGCYTSYQDYYNRMCDYAMLAGDGRSFISFDNYPFGPTAGSVDENALFGNLDSARKAGLKTDTPTAFYIQAVGGFGNSYRRPDEGQLTYHMGAALAYGFKWIKYWSWFVPDYGTDPENTTYNDYTDAIIGKDGKPTDMYPVAQKLHAKIHTLGSTLVKLDAAEIYHTGSKSKADGVYDLLPAEFFIQPTDSNVYSIVSLMKNPETGAQYIMFVNKDMRREKTLTFNCNTAGIKEISGNDGSYINADIKDGVWSITLKAGDFALFELPEGKYSLVKSEKSDNLLKNAYASATGSTCGDGWFINCLTDGIRISKPSAKGWKASGGTSVTYDLGEKKTFNRVDIYPAGNGVVSGSGFPTEVKISVSDDGKTFREVLTQALERPKEDAPSFKLGEQSGRYVKFEFVLNRGEFEVGEIELYNDTGSIPAPAKTDYSAASAQTGTNYALNKTATASGSAYESVVDKWSLNYVTDGSKLQTEADGTNGWMSNGVKKVTDETWVYVDLATEYEIDRVVVYPRQNGKYFPTGYGVFVSLDGESWTKVAEVNDDTETDGVQRTLDFDPVTARFVKFQSSKLTGGYVDFANGYLMQISEFEVYKR